MRVLLACPYAWDAPGGVQVHVRQLAGRLLERGHQVLVLAPSARGAEEPWVRIVGRPLRMPYAGTVAPICFSFGSWRRIRAALERFSPDVIHVHEPMTPSTSMLVVGAAPAPVVATFHAFLRRSRLLEVAAPALGWAWRRLDARVAVSEAAAAFVARAFPGPVEVIPNGLETERFASAAPAEDLPAGRRILWVNRLDPQKGFPVALRAFVRLAAEFPDLSLVVAGDGRDREAIAMLSSEEAARVVMLGTVSHDRVPAYHAACEVLVSPALGQESFGIVLVEAMAAGLPVVASDIPGYREVVRDGTEGLLVPPGDPGALADAVRWILADPDLAARFGKAGRERAAAFSWDRVVPRLEAVYERAARGRP